MPTLGLCVIAKNAAPTIRACLESVRGLVGAAVVVDTGSADETAQIAGECGARVISFSWANDFSAARNAALQAIETDWVLVLDADEELDGAAHAWIRKELQAPSADGYVTPVRNYTQPWDQGLTGQHAIPPGERPAGAPSATHYVHSEVCRLYRRDREIYYTGHVHEQVEYRMMQLGRPIARAGFFIHHFGWYLIDEQGLERKRKLYHDLLAEKLRERPHDPQVLLQYGDALCAWSGKVEEGLACFMKSAALKSDHPPIWMYIASALMKLNQMEAALIAIEQVPSQGEYVAKRAQLKGEAYGALGRWGEAREHYVEALRHYPDSISMQAKLALIEMELGESPQGIARMREAIAAAEEQAYAHTHAYPYLYAAELHAQIKQWNDALRMANAGLHIDAALLPLQELRLRAAVATQEFEQAAEAAERISVLRPTPKTALRHAAILHRSGRHQTAMEVLESGLERYPLSQELRQAREELEAQQAWVAG